MIKKYPAEVETITRLAEDVFSVKFKSLAANFKFSPGQFLHLALDEVDPSQPWPDSRCFSIQSPPDMDFLKITYSVKGKFTRRMATEMKTRSHVTLKLPYGELFTQEHHKENTVFLAGGTGITPFLSLFNSQSFSGYKSPVLFAGFRNRTYNKYVDELDNAKLLNTSFTTHYIYEDETGLIDLRQIVTDQNRNSSFFISGPPQMIRNFKSELQESGIPKHQIKTDDWE